MRDSPQKGAGMREQDPPFQTLKDARRFVDCTRRQILVPVFSPARRVRIYQKKRVKENRPIFDLLGFLSPFTVRGKLLIQKTWTETVS